MDVKVYHNQLVSTLREVLQYLRGAKAVSMSQDFTYFNPKKKIFSLDKEAVAEDIISSMKDLIEKYPEEAKKVDVFIVDGLYGANPSKPDTTVSIRFGSPGSRKFGRDMSAGRYGSLD